MTKTETNKSDFALRGLVRDAAEIPTPTYDSISKEFSAMKDSSCCALIAVALISGESPKAVSERFETLGREKGKPTPNKMTCQILEDLGFDLESYPIAKVIKSYPGVHSNLKNVTTGHATRFPEAWNSHFEGKTLLVSSTAHISAFIDGVNRDWSRNRSKRVDRISIVTKSRRKARKTVAPKK